VRAKNVRDSQRRERQPRRRALRAVFAGGGAKVRARNAPGDPLPRARSSIRLILLSALAIVVAVWGVSVLAISEQRRAAVQHGQNEAGNLAVAFRAEVERSLATVNETMNILEVRIRSEGPAFDLPRWAAQTLLVSTGTIQVALIDRNGRLAASSLLERVKPIDLSDRAHFRVHLHGPTGRLFIGDPVVGRVSKKTTIQLSRRMNDAHGALLYVIVFSVEPRYLTTLNKSIYLGERGTITLLGSEGTVRARFTSAHSDGLDNVGKNLVSPEFTAGIRLAETGSYTAASRIDGISRIYSFARVGSYPLYVVAGLPLDTVVAAPRAFAALFVTLASLTTLLMLGLGVFLAREIWRGANRELALRETQNALERALASAEEADRAKTMFFAMMSHEIKTPMNGILGLTRSLLKTNLDRRQAEILRLVRDSSSTLLRILNDILDLTRLESAPNDLRLEDFSPISLTRSVALIFAERARERELTLIVKDDIDPAIVLHGDSGRVRQVLWNLVSNAIKFTEKGSVTLAATAAETTKTQMTVRWTVTDTGIGIAAERLGGLFQSFVQADASIQRRYGGTGLGLAISRTLVESLGGSITVSSSPGAGSVFTVAVPFAFGDAAKRDGDDERELAELIRARVLRHANAYRVLVAEDDPASRLLLTMLLRDVNVRADAVEDGKAAVSDASLTPYDMIFMDMQMPELDGLAATRAIRKGDGPCAATPIIGVTANVFAEDIARCTAAGMNDVLQKPVSEEALYRILGRLLGDVPNAGLVAAAAPERHLGNGAAVEGRSKTPRLRVMPLFLESTAHIVAEMQAAGADGNALQLARLAHRLKSSSLAIDATTLANVCRRVELAGVSDDMGAALAALEPLAAEYATTCDAVRTELAGGRA
jgi:signal transduction histidine kinase/CheY-like chemotaxis protein/HPt (histidine-containing phosphotransfer) domain-containing protein